jgi:hypothetical protein
MHSVSVDILIYYYLLFAKIIVTNVHNWRNCLITVTFTAAHRGCTAGKDGSKDA